MDLVIDDFEEQIPTADLPHLPNVENVNFENMKRRLHSTIDRFDGWVLVDVSEIRPVPPFQKK